MKKLLIINKKVNFFEKKKILLGLKFKSHCIIDFNFDNNLDFYKSKNISKKIIQSNLILEKKFFYIKTLFEKKIISFLKKNPDFVKYKFSEINFSDFWWKLIINCELINNFCERNKITNIEIFEDFNSHVGCALYFNKNKKYKIKRKLNLKLYFYRFFLTKIFLLNFLKEIYSLLYAKKLYNKKKIKQSNLVFTSFPNGWIFFKDTYNRFFGNKINNNKNCYLLSISRNNQYSLIFSNKLNNRIKKLNNYCILESYGSIKNIIQCYFFSFINKSIIYKKIDKIFKNEFISRILTYGIFLVEEPKNNVFENSISEFSKINKINKIINPIPEFIDGRIINNFFNNIKVKTYSVQHSSIGVLQYSRFVVMINILKKINKNYVPKVLFVENDKTKQNMNNFKNNIKVVGNVRIKLRKLLKKTNTKNIYYICEMHNVSLLKNKIKKILSIFLDKKLYIRLHPGKIREQTKIVNSIKEYQKRLFIDYNKSMFETFRLKNPSLIFTSSPTVYNELMANSLKAILLKDNSFFTNYPIDIQRNRVLKTLNFNLKDLSGKTHKVDTKFFGLIAEDKINNFFNE